MNIRLTIEFEVCRCHNNSGGGTMKIHNPQVAAWNPGMPTAEVRGMDDEGHTITIAVHKDSEGWDEFKSKVINAAKQIVTSKSGYEPY